MSFSVFLWLVVAPIFAAAAIAWTIVLLFWWLSTWLSVSLLAFVPFYFFSLLLSVICFENTYLSIFPAFYFRHHVMLLALYAVNAIRSIDSIFILCFNMTVMYMKCYTIYRYTHTAHLLACHYRYIHLAHWSQVWQLWLADYIHSTYMTYTWVDAHVYGLWFPICPSIIPVFNDAAHLIYNTGGTGLFHHFWVWIFANILNMPLTVLYAAYSAFVRVCMK